MSFEPIDSLIITRKTSKYWTLQVNEETETRASSAYEGIRTGDFITIKTNTGAPITMVVPYSVIQYFDSMDSANNLTAPQNSDEMFSHLLDQDFFLASSGGSGGGAGVNNFLELLDVLFPAYIGRDGEAIVINGNGLDSAPFNASIAFEDLTNWLGGDLLPNQYILSDSMGAGLVQASINNIVNRAHAYDEYQILDKGYTWDGDTIIPNEDLYSLQIGDVIRKWFYVLPSEEFPSGQVLLMENGRYKGGDINVPLNYIHSGLKSYAFDTDPDKEI